MNLVTIELIDRHRSEFEALCRKYRVRRLDIFGSILTGQFDPAHSDVDFMVEYLPETDLGPWLTRYFELREALSAAVGVRADVLLEDVRAAAAFVIAATPPNTHLRPPQAPPARG